MSQPPTYFSSYGPYMISQPQMGQSYVFYSGSYPIYPSSYGQMSPISVPVSPQQYSVAPMPAGYGVGYVGRPEAGPRQFEVSPGSSPQSANAQIEKTVNYPVRKLTNCGAVSVESFQRLEALYRRIKVKKYATSAIDSIRNYLTVFEYAVNDSWVMWDYDTGYVHLTGIWKAAFSDEVNHPIKSKCDIVKLVDSTPKEYHPYIKRIRGGFLKIQGTWLPFNLCKILARRFCYYIRYELVPLFGNDFPDYCLKPGDKGFGELRFDSVEAAAPRKLLPRVSPLMESPVLHRRAHSDTRRGGGRGRLARGVRRGGGVAVPPEPLAAVAHLQ